MESIIRQLLRDIRSDLPDTPAELVLLAKIRELIGAETEACAQIAESFIPSGFTGHGKAGNTYAVARDDRARTIATAIRERRPH